jgi:hypothetical protein
MRVSDYPQIGEIVGHGVKAIKGFQSVTPFTSEWGGREIVG